jgi:D-alanine-D-alanine ligase
VLGGRDYGRIDLRLDANGAPYFIEANLTPGLSERGYLARCYKYDEKKEYDDMIYRIVDLAFERSNAPTVADFSRMM